jgi:hypothetical protein
MNDSPEYRVLMELATVDTYITDARETESLEACAKALDKAAEHLDKARRIAKGGAA